MSPAFSFGYLSMNQLEKGKESAPRQIIQSHGHPNYLHEQAKPPEGWSDREKFTINQSTIEGKVMPLNSNPQFVLEDGSQKWIDNEVHRVIWIFKIVSQSMNESNIFLLLEGFGS